MADNLESSEFTSLKAEQRQAIECLLEGKDVLGVLPTGFGKSRIFQAFSKIQDERSVDSVVLVIAPLRSIIQDQLSTLERMEYPGADLKSLDEAALKECKFKILFGSAEDVLSRPFQDLLSNTALALHQRLSLIVVDESHTVETWSGKR